jgi:hypothetical protein
MSESKFDKDVKQFRILRICETLANIISLDTNHEAKFRNIQRQAVDLLEHYIQFLKEDENAEGNKS